MIPYRLQFSGIRDFVPTSLNLSGDGHLMITGPNGSGKSTLTFCMGAALRSAKVDIEGLKSQNLPADAVWRAHVSLLFKNEGQMKIDEPTFIQFTINIVQEPSQPIKREFIIEKGEVIDEWEEQIKYTSGDSYHNFTNYSTDLQFRYKIHPDVFYLIWYQQEVNQFAIMSPAERFRIFSEMHGIDHMQKNWEESIEKVKETEDTLRSAEQNTQMYKMSVNILHDQMQRFLSNQKRLRDGAKLIFSAQHHLEKLYEKEMTTLKRLLEDLTEEIAEKQVEKAETAADKEAMAATLERLEKQVEQIEQAIEHLDTQINVENNRLEDIIKEKNSLAEELDELIEKQKQIVRSEEIAHRDFSQLSKELTLNEQELEQLKRSITEKDQSRTEMIENGAQLKSEIAQDEKQAKAHQDKLNHFKSSFQVEQSIKRLEKQLSSNRKRLAEADEEIIQLIAEEVALQEDRTISARQKESLAYFKEQKIVAFPLRELIELDHSAKLADEKRFDAIKYTVFFNSTTATPPNDLYHVPLMSTIPNRWKDKLPTLHLKTKAHLSGEKLNHAVKALHWVEQFFKDEEPLIKNDVIVDSRGFRGPQEKDEYILSQQARQNRLTAVQKEIEQMTTHLKQIQIEIDQDTKEFQHLNSEIQKVREAEASLTKQQEREQKKVRLTVFKERESLLEQELIHLRDAADELRQVKASLTEQLKIVQKELDFYEELGQSKEKYKKLEQRHQLEKNARERINELTTEQEMKDTKEAQLNRRIKQTRKQADDTTQYLDDISREEQQLTKQLTDTQDKLEVYQNESVLIMRDLQEMGKLVPELYAEFSSELREPTKEKPDSEEALKAQREDGRIMFDRARSEEDIDPAAVENHQKAKEEYDRLENEYKQSKSLLEADIERTDALKDQLETTINMHVLEIQKKFVVYMGEFQFQGDISWESYDDKKGRTHFNLYIKARKEGHRGSLVDVSDKARGGKVGKGVSGGEESLSSLLFALALLQNIDTAPGFIVLDEFDSALDDHRKLKVFDLYVDELKRKLIILTPKTHEEDYINRFQKAFVVQHDPRVPQSKVTGLVVK